MKKILLLILIGLVAAPFVAWKVERDRRVDVLVVDESVRSEKRDSHAGLVWLLDQAHLRPTGRPRYDLTDYYGFFPDRNRTGTRFSRNDLEGTDLLYLADAHGVWRSGLESFEMMRDRDRDEWIHSGYSYNEVRAIQDRILNGDPVMAEAFLFYAQHEGGAATLKRLEDSFGASWTGWIGGWFKELNNIQEVPFWVRGMYERKKLEQWPYRGPGVLLIRPSTGDFVLLSPGIELRTPRPEIAISQRNGILESGVESNLPLYGFFEIVEAVSPEMVWASIRLPVTGAGQQALEENNIPASFPLLVVQRVDRKTWYLTADMGNVPTWLGPSHMKWGPELRASVASLVESQVPGEDAFWRFYIPMMNNLLQTLAR